MVWNFKKKFQPLKIAEKLSRSDFLVVNERRRTKYERRTMQEAIMFECPVCKNRNYHSTKNKKQNPDKLNLSKFCKFCKKHTLHKEMK